MFKKYIFLTLFFFLLVVFFLFTPYLLFSSFDFPFTHIFLVFLLNGIFFFYLFKQIEKERRDFRLRAEEFSEERNLKNLTANNLNSNIEGLKKNIKRYNMLEYLVKEMNKIIDLDDMVDFITERTHALFENSDTCMIYLLNQEKQKFELCSTFKKDTDTVIKAKQGDVIDQWLFHHRSAILIEDIKKDFRFDIEKFKSKKDEKRFASVISVPLTNEKRLVGSIRLESSSPNFFNSNDLRFLDTLSDICSLAISNALLYKKTRELAITDSLTGLYTRKHLMERFKEELSRAARQDSHLAVFMLDIDNFKNYNDTFGHTAGDLVLKKISKLLYVFSPRHEAIVSRYGGEEFTILYPGLDQAKAKVFAEKIRQQISQETIILRRKKTRITVSIGVSVFPQNGLEPKELIKAADDALLKAKKQGKNCTCLS